MANNFYGCIAPTGGTNGALDKIDGSILADGDGAFVIDASGNTINVYTLDSGSGAAESAPEIISPDTNAGTKRWILVKIVALGADFNGYEVVLDADGDTSITADTDDQIDFKTGGSDRMSLTNAGLALASGSRITEFSTDGTMAGDSDTAVPTEQAVVEYVDSIAGKGGSGVVAYRNKFINGNFDIWQRGISFTTTGVYSADRWKTSFVGGGAVAQTVTQQKFTVGQTEVPGGPTYYLRSVNTTSGAVSGLVAIIQAIEDVALLAGQDVIVSFYAKSSAGSDLSVSINQSFGSGGSATVTVAGSKVTTTTDWAKYSVTITLPSITGKTVGAGSFNAVYIWMDAGSDWDALTDSLGNQSDTFNLAQIQLEIGSNATAFDVRHIGTELELCQRYYQKSFDLTTTPANAVYAFRAVGVAYAANNVVAAIELPVPLRISTGATCASYGSGTSRVEYFTGAGFADSTGTTIIQQNHAQIIMTITGVMTATAAYLLRGDYTISAEL